MGLARPLRVSDIKATVQEYYGLGPDDLESAKRARGCVWPRQMAMTLAKRHTNSSFPEIGRRFGGRDHTTVLHAVRAVEKRCLDRPEIADDLAALERLLSCRCEAKNLEFGRADTATGWAGCCRVCGRTWPVTEPIKRDLSSKSGEGE